MRLGTLRYSVTCQLEKDMDLTDVFLLSHGNAKLFLDKERWPKGYVSMKMQYSYH